MRTQFLSIATAGLAGLAALTGCDSGTELETFTGPTVQFAASSMNAAEGDGTIEIPVSLSGAAEGQQVTVEVLYAAASSSVDYDDDVSGFGIAEGDNRVATVTLTGPEDTQTVTIDVVEDSEPEAAEAAVFVLQRVSEGAQIGDTREFRLEIGTPPIADVRGRDLGQTVTIEGIVTSAQNRYTFIQDGTAGIVVYEYEDQPFGEAVANGSVSVGDRVQIVGELGEFRGLLQVVDVTDYEVLSSGNELPDPQSVTVGQLLTSDDAYESELVRIEGLTVEGGAVVFEGGSNTLTDGTGTATAYLQFGSTLEDQPVPSEPFTYVGPIGEYQGTNQLNPLSACEIVELRGVAVDDNGDVIDCSAYAE